MNETEREIVAWLRGPEKQRHANRYKQYRDEGCDDGSAEQCLVAALNCFDVANAIERGDHRQHSPAKEDSQ